MTKSRTKTPVRNLSANGRHAHHKNRSRQRLPSRFPRNPTPTATCGKSRNAKGRASPCRNLLCNYCNKLFITTRIPRVQSIYGPIPKSDIYVVEVRYGIRHQLYDPVTTSQTPNSLKGLSADIKCFRQSLVSALFGIDSVLLNGTLGVNLQVFDNGRQESEQFATAFQKGNGKPALAKGSHYFCLHGRFLISAWDANRYLDANEIRTVLRKKFPLAYAIRVRNLRKPMSKVEGVKDCISWSPIGDLGHATQGDLQQLAGAYNTLLREQVTVTYNRGHLRPRSFHSAKRKSKKHGSKSNVGHPRAGGRNSTRKTGVNQ